MSIEYDAAKTLQFRANNTSSRHIASGKRQRRRAKPLRASCGWQDKRMQGCEAVQDRRTRSPRARVTDTLSMTDARIRLWNTYDNCSLTSVISPKSIHHVHALFMGLPPSHLLLQSWAKPQIVAINQWL